MDIPTNLAGLHPLRLAAHLLVLRQHYENGNEITAQDFKNAEKHELLKPPVIAAICILAVFILALGYAAYRVLAVRSWRQANITDYCKCW